MRKTYAIIAFFVVFSCVYADEIIWQLGTSNGSCGEFSPHYFPWEYGSAPGVQKSPAMDHKTHTFNYEIKNNKIISNPQVVSGLSTESELVNMKSDEVVTGLKLSWNEVEAGTRRLELNITGWRNKQNGQKGIEIDLPGGGKKVVNLPKGESRKVLEFSASCPVKAGKNTLTIRVVSMAKHYRLHFDSIALYKTTAPPEKLPVVLKRSFSSQDGIYHPGDQVKLNLRAWNLPKEQGAFTCAVKDAFGKQVAKGRGEFSNGTGSINFPADKRGYFNVEVNSGGSNFAASYVVVEPVKTEYIADSRFGAHPLRGDRFFIREWREREETALRRAFLAGVKWVRHHSMHWFLREPEKGKFDWTYFDDRVKMLEKYKMNMLLTLTGTPKWTSTSQDKKFTVCGTYRYQNCPPKNWQDLADYIEVVVDRYKNRIKWYEMGNEPGFTSAFWCNGSAEDYATLLKTSYEAAKKADPDCIVLSGAPLTTDFMGEVIKHNGGKFYFDVMSVHYLKAFQPGGGIVKKWKKFMEQVGGGNIPMVNTEEMHWRNAAGQKLGISGPMIKTYVREAALGIEKTFAFDLFCTGSIYNASVFDYQGNVLPGFAAYRTMTHRLEHAKFVADLSTSESEAYLFDRQGTPVIVAWSDKDRMINLPISTKTAKVIDIMDVETVRSVAAGTLELQGSDLPQFIEGGSIKQLIAYADVLKTLPREIMIKPGKSVRSNLALNEQISDLKLQLPDSWKGVIDRSKLQMSVPVGAPLGIYDAKVSFSLAGATVSVPLQVNVSNDTAGTSSIRNGDFAKGTAYWFYPKDKKRFDCVRGAGINGGNAVKTTGKVFFGCAGKVKVRKGDRYALIVEAKGEGRFGGVTTTTDKNGKKLFKAKQGINCLDSKVDSEWKTFSEEIIIAQPEASFLKFAILANHGDKSNKQIYFNRFAVVRLTDRFTFNKAVYQGECAKTQGMPSDWNKIPAMKVGHLSEVAKNVGRSKVIKGKATGWAGPEDLSASCRVAMDNKYLYLRFDVKDSNYKPTSSRDANGWKYDSIQFAIDPTMEGKDRTEILIAGAEDGKTYAWKFSNFWTPELPENITRNGLIKNVKIELKKNNDGITYIVAVPLNEIYPLSAKTKEFGFSWLVNDNDGQDRKYIQWSNGIGDKKKPELFGLIKKQ